MRGEVGPRESQFGKVSVSGRGGEVGPDQEGLGLELRKYAGNHCSVV